MILLNEKYISPGLEVSMYSFDFYKQIPQISNVLERWEKESF